MGVDPEDGDSFLDFFQFFVSNGINTDSKAANFLFWLRTRLGAMFAWDGQASQQTSPADDERSLTLRLTEEDHQRNTIHQQDLPMDPLVNPNPIYLFEDESLAEITNKTIHALVHMGWVDDQQESGKKRVVMSVYIKTKGTFSRLY